MINVVFEWFLSWYYIKPYNGFTFSVRFFPKLPPGVVNCYVDNNSQTSQCMYLIHKEAFTLKCDNE